MKSNSVLSAVILIPVLLCGRAVTALGADQCAACHGLLGDAPSTQFRKDVHHAKGITCAGCHGGDAASDDMASSIVEGHKRTTLVIFSGNL